MLMPSRRNAYRPHLLRRDALLFLLALALAVEGFFVGGLMLSADPRGLAAFALSSIITVLVVALVLAFFVHPHVRPTDLVVSGMAVLALVASLYASNLHFFGSPDTPLAQVADVAVGAAGVVR